MKKLMFATALVASAAAFADGPTALNATSFEGYNSVDGSFLSDKGDVGEGGGAKYFYYAGDSDGSLVKAFGGDNLAVPGITRPFYYASAATNDKYLELSTEGGILWRSINVIQGEANAYELGEEVAVAADGIYLDTLIQFTPTEDGGAPEVDGSDKLAIWLNVDSSGSAPVTNLMVKAGFVDDNGTSTTQTPTTYTLTTASPMVAGQWYRLTIKAIADVTKQVEKNPDAYPSGYMGFEIYLDGVLLTATTPAFGQGFIALATDAGEFGWLKQVDDASVITYLRSGTVFPALGLPVTSATLQGVGFKGSGALDDIVWTEENPFANAGIDFTLTWPASMTPVSYAINDGAAQPLGVGTSMPFHVPGLASGDTVTFIVANADGAQKTLTGTVGTDSGLDATGVTFGWPEYLGDAVNGAYTIDDANDLDMLRKGVAAGLETAGTNFNQTANINMASAGPFAGIGTYASNLSSGVPFQGTYDGQGHKISDVLFTIRTYAGIFNQVKGGTIKNLTVENISFPEVDYIVTTGGKVTTNEYGCAIIGNAGLGATLQGLVAMGDFGTTAIPCTHNVAGIAVRVCGGASNVVNGVTMLETLVKDCTNNATLHGTYSKLGGISALTQDQNKVPNDYVKYDGCVNNGTIIATTFTNAPKKPGVDGISGIVAYTADATQLKDCVNNGTYSSTFADARAAELVGYHQGQNLTDLGGNKGDATKKMVYTQVADKIFGFKYATVDNGVATTVDAALAKDTTYLLEGNVAASETPVFTLAAAGDWIEFDAALGYTFAGTVAGEGVTNETTGTVIKYWIPTAGGSDYQVTIGSDDVVITPTAEDLAAFQQAGIDTSDVAAVNAALDTVITNGVKVWEALFLGLPPTEAGLESFKIDSITIGADGKVTVTLPASVSPKTGRGVNITLKLKAADTPNAAPADWTDVESASGTTFAPFAPGSTDTKKFYKVVVEFAGSSAQN